MYCSYCGTAVSQGLSYCKRCGARLGEIKADSVTGRAELFPDSLVWAIVSVFVVGLGSIMGLMAIMKKLDINEGFINAMTLLTFSLMIAVEAVFIWLLASRSRGPKDAGRNARLQDRLPRGVEEIGPRELPEPATSVTENTTRSFNPARISDTE